MIHQKKGVVAALSFILVALFYFSACEQMPVNSGTDREISGSTEKPNNPEPDSISHGFVDEVTPGDDPQFAERTYPVIQADWPGPGGDKRWLGWNLGATAAPSSLSDDSPESAGWYFQFNRQKGIYPGVPNDEQVAHHTPGSVSGQQIPELDSDWTEDNPCSSLLGGSWRIPTEGEWNAVVQADAGEDLNLHYSGYIIGNISFLSQLGSEGYYWSSTQYMSANRAVFSTLSSDLSVRGGMLMWSGLPLRCIEG